MAHNILSLSEITLQAGKKRKKKEKVEGKKKKKKKKKKKGGEKKKKKNNVTELYLGNKQVIGHFEEYR